MSDGIRALSDIERRFVEAMVVAHEGKGLSPVSGRIVAHMLLANEPLSSKALAESVGASRSAVSTATQALVRMGFIERQRRPGSRETWYVVRPNLWLHIFARELRFFSQLHTLAEAVVEARGEQQPVSGCFSEFLSFYTFMSSRMPVLFEEWKAVSQPKEHADK